MGKQEGSTFKSEGPHYSTAKAIKDALQDKAGLHLTSLSPDKIQQEWTVLMESIHCMLKGSSQNKWAVALHFALTHLYEEKSNNQQKQRMSLEEFSDYTTL